MRTFLGLIGIGIILTGISFAVRAANYPNPDAAMILAGVTTFVGLLNLLVAFLVSD